MKILLFAFVSISVALLSCDNKVNTNKPSIRDSTNMTPTVSKSTLSSGCYSMIQQRDTAILDLAVFDTNLSGRLRYQRFEKDDNDGVIDGVIRDSLVIANYTFQSEGRSSVRQIALLIKGDSLFEGYGEIRNNGDTALFVNISQLKFITTPFVKVDCAGLP